MQELDYKESWALKNWCFWTVVLEKTLESSLDCKEIKLVNPKGNQSWIFIGRTDAEAETLILWLPDVKSWLIGKDHDAGKDWRREEKGTTEDEMVGWHHRLNGRVWASSRSWWWTGKPGMLQSIASQSWTQLSNWTDWLTSKGLTCPCRRCKRQEFDPWVGKIPWRRNGNPLPYSCLENSWTQEPGRLNTWGHRELDKIERMSTHTYSRKATGGVKFS